MATHTVKSGESLSAIAARFGTTVRAIADANGIENPDLIFEGQELTIPNGQVRPRSTGPVFAADQFSNEPNAFIGFEALMPFIQQCADHYGTDAQTMAAIVMQESSFINHIVHADGTGHGLVGLDDGGLLRSFERFTGETFGRGHNARSIHPEWQMEYLAKTLNEFTGSVGSLDRAARAWHTGEGNVDSENGVDYSRRLARHKQTLFGA